MAGGGGALDRRRGAARAARAAAHVPLVENVISMMKKRKRFEPKMFHFERSPSDRNERHILFDTSSSFRKLLLYAKIHLDDILSEMGHVTLDDVAQRKQMIISSS